MKVVVMNDRETMFCSSCSHAAKPFERTESKRNRRTPARQSRQLFAACALVGVGVLSFGGRREQESVVKAREFVLVDESGNALGKWASPKDGSVSFELYKPDSDSLRNVISVSQDGVPEIQMLDEAGQPRMFLGLDLEGMPYALFSDTHGATRLALSLKSSMVETVDDPRGSGSELLKIVEGGAAEIILYDSSSRIRGSLTWNDADDVCEARLFDDEGVEFVTKLGPE